MRKSHIVAATLVFGAATASTASAAFVTEYFNNYGTVAGIDLAGLGSAGGGWAGAWTGGLVEYATTGPAPEGSYPGLINFANPGYDNSNNEFGANDGLARRNSNQSAGTGHTDLSTRAFSEGLTGEIWVSALGNVNGARAGVTLWLDSPADDNISVRNIGGATGTPITSAVRINGVDNSSNATTFAGGNFYMFIAKLGIDVDGSNDSLKFWAKTVGSNISSEAALGTPLYDISGVDIFGTSLDGVGVSLQTSNAAIDAIRISNDADAYEKVVSVPEPASLGLLAMGGLAMLRRRR